MIQICVKIPVQIVLGGPSKFCVKVPIICAIILSFLSFLPYYWLSEFTCYFEGLLELSYIYFISICPVSNNLMRMFILNFIQEHTSTKAFQKGLILFLNCYGMTQSEAFVQLLPCGMKRTTHLDQKMVERLMRSRKNLSK